MDDKRHNSSSQEEKNELPKSLKRYSNSDFGMQQRVVFVYRLSVAIAISLVIMILYTGYVQTINPFYNNLFFPVLIPEFSILAIVIFCQFLLIKGYYNFAAQLLLLTTLTTVWVVMFLDKSHSIARLDTVVFIFAILSALPLLVHKAKPTLIIVFLNIIVLIIFVSTTYKQLNLEKSEIVDYISDFTISITFLGIVVYNISKINKQSFDKAIKDISDRHEAELALIQSEKKYADTIDLLPQTIFEADLTGRLTYVNKVAFEAFGYTIQDILSGTNVLSMIVESDRKLASENIRNILNNKPAGGNHYTALRKDGSTFPIQIYSKLIETNGEAVGFRGIIIDITEIAESEKALKQSEMFRKRVFDSSNIPIVIMEPSTFKFIDLNVAAVKAYGFNSIEETLGRTPLDVSAPIQYDGSHSSDKTTANIIKAINEGSAKFEWRHQRPNGEIWDAEVYLLPFKSNNRTLIQFSLIDITERKKAENALKQSEELARNLIEVSPNAILLNDMNLHYLLVNNAFCSITGYSLEEVLGKTPFEVGLNFNPEIHKIIKDKLNKNGIIENIEAAITNKYGEIIDVYYSGRIIQSNNQPIILSSIINITKIKQIERELEKHRNHLEVIVKERTEELAAANKELLVTNEELYIQRKELEDALKILRETQDRLIQSEKMASLGILAAGVAHEINNPLNFINGGAVGIENYIDENFKEHFEEVAPLLEGIKIGVKRAADIVSSLNHYSRRDDLPCTKCDVNEIINNCLIILNNQIKNSIEVEKDFDNSAYDFFCNEGRLHQVFLNILTNAIHSIEDTGKIKILTKVNKDLLEIKVIDTGCGISRENLPRITDPFFTTKDPGKGTGLGLSITFNIIQEYKGTLHFESELGRGTTATITFPIN